MAKDKVKYSSNIKAVKFISWFIPFIIGWLIITESINLLLGQYLGYTHGVIGLIQSSVNIFLSPNCKNFFSLFLFLFTIFLTMQLFILLEENLKLYFYKALLPQAIREHKIFKSQLNKTVIKLVDIGDESQIQKRDETYAELLRHLKPEFDLEGVSISSIELCINNLKTILQTSEKINEIFAVTDFSGESWLTRTMLIYLIRTIQIADKINENTNKIRLFLRSQNSNDKKSFDAVCSLHHGYFNYKIFDKGEYLKKFNSEHPAFLYIKTNENMTFYWSVKNTDKGLIWNLELNTPENFEEIIKFIRELNGEETDE